ncbi:methyltransferase domain-containing protein [Sphingobacterium alkalisoli]|uniref:Methyltransferase domain-containing protein n=1 Tax=Sphingobacterium alkalisoli TaxID=1874115 RepID=A0A4U0H5X3_9SPHI|nr:methyltransferase domain-containing protein [Sphingobacterium alkalisoli]TJY67058.1 methyltransferase domain-containing protein [Sphingobacterium alkalisoli]GGH12499.1 hypothetical protein GCM10011418_12100 [Sphingobacterium alkalisoli]
MPDFSKRSYDRELLDDPLMPFEQIKQTMRELNIINTWLGGHRVTVKGLRELLNGKRQISICEIGCGGGDNLAVLHGWCQQHGIEATFTGIDINPHSIAFAKEVYGELGIEFVCSDYRANALSTKPDIFFNSLFCHHFTENELIDMLKWMRINSRIGFFINDLHRHPVAYYSIKWLTKLLSKSSLVKNDAPLSVRRGFKKAEWIKLFDSAGLPLASPRWEWAFRHLIVCKNGWI